MVRPKPVIVGSVVARPIRAPDAEGRWYWRARRRVDGKRETVWAGRAHRNEVEPILVALAADPGKRAPRKDVRDWTVDDLLDHWMGYQMDREGVYLRPVTVDGRRRSWARLTQRIGEVRLDRITADTLERMVCDRLRARPTAAATIILDVSVLRQAWRWGREHGVVPDRDLPRIRIPQPSRERRTPTRAEVLAVLAALRRPWPSGHRPPEWAVRLIWLAWASGCRRGELADLRWGDVDLEAGTIRVVGKTGPRTVPLARPALAEIATWTTGDPEARVWPVGGLRARMGPNIILRHACDVAGVERFTLQALRRHATDALYESGADPGIESAVVGHSDRTALREYRRARGDSLRRAVERAGLGVEDEQVIEVDFRRR